MTSLRRLGLPCAAALALFAFGCDDPPPPGRDSGMPDTGPGEQDAGPGVDAGPACLRDEDCDDGVACTADRCQGGTCVNAIIPNACDDGLFCNGVERCDPAAGGCVPALTRQTCNDDDVCTIDRCDEETDRCLHLPRDLDEDGDPDWFCPGGGDCDDTNPDLSSLVAEVCDDGIDNDCDGIPDEAMCGRPRYDVCEDALDVSAGGFFEISTVGRTHDYPTTCFLGSPRDVVLTFTLSEPRSVTIEAESDVSSVGLSLRSTCADMASEIACRSGFVASLRRRRLETGTYYLVVSGNGATPIGLDVRFDEPLGPAANDTCDGALDVGSGGMLGGSFVETRDDLTTSCGFAGQPDLVYVLNTSEEHNVRVTARAGTERLTWALRTSCSDASTDLRCIQAGPADGTVYQVPAGTYYLVVEGPSTREVDFDLNVELLPPSPPPAGDLCSDPIELTPGTYHIGSFLDFQDDVDISCGFRYREAVHSFTIDEASDVTILLEGTASTSMSLRTACEDGASQLICAVGNPSRARLRGLAAGTYYVIAESPSGGSYRVRVETSTPPTLPVAVSGNEDCSTAHVIPETGGVFTGDTTAMAGDYTTSPLADCGLGAASPDAVFRLDLSARKRVIATTDGSAFDTVLYVHRDACTSGAELFCNDDDPAGGITSMIDRVFEAGTYFFVVDGWGMVSGGAYVLDVVVADP